MIEELAKAARRPVSRETYERLEAFVALLKAGSEQQNLVSASTLGEIWTRHILDSAQLLRFEPRTGASWADIGSGAGLPGIVIACLTDGPVALIEPRRLRADFLSECGEKLGLSVSVHRCKAERMTGRFDVITGRAVASLARFLGLSLHLSTKNTVWVLPKGRNARSELAEAESAWQGDFRIEQSVTDAQSSIVVGTGVRAKRR